jgi:hypothetical protein
MIVCFRCSQETKENLDSLIASGAYKDIAEAIEAAVRNQALMEQEIAKKGAVIIGESSSAPVMPPDCQMDQTNGECLESAPIAARKNGKSKKERASPKDKDSTAKTIPSMSRANIPDLFHLEGLPSEPPEGLADLAGDMWANGQIVPLDRWILGQYNRLLPAKANSRALIRLFTEDPRSLTISQTAERIAAEAATLGDYLAARDEMYELSRDDALATAFPTTAEGGDKGKSRYANQFVVYQNGRGELSGLMVDFKLINVTRFRKELLIVPTRMAWELAILPSPVLDGMGAEKFSGEERMFLVRHIVQSIPVEAFAYRAILDAVSNGHSSPDAIDANLRGFVTKDRAEKLSVSFLASQRSGAVSRMSDLGLIARKRDGVRVSYQITDAGRSFQNYASRPGSIDEYLESEHFENKLA